MRVRIDGNDGEILKRNLAVLLVRAGHELVEPSADVVITLGSETGDICIHPHDGDATTLDDRTYRPANVFGRWDDDPGSFNAWLKACAREGFRPLHRPESFDVTPIDAACEVILAMVESRPVAGNGSTHIRPVDVEGFVHLFDQMRGKARFAPMDDPFVRRLYAAYLSHLDVNNLHYSLDVKTDHRGCLAELMKSPHTGQVFVSWSKPGVVRGSHYHDAKAEKFMILSGTARIRLRHLLTDELREWTIQGRDLQAVDVPPGWVHDIANVGEDDMLALFWVSQMFDPTDLDTHIVPMEPEA